MIQTNCDLCKNTNICKFREELKALETDFIGSPFIAKCVAYNEQYHSDKEGRASIIIIVK